MSTMLPNLPDTISGIITLGANGGEQLFLPKIHTVLYHMRQHDSMLTNLWFSITGSVCYSRDIENVLRNLASLGVVKIEADSVIVKNNGFLRNRLRNMLPVRQYRKLLRTSRKFYALHRLNQKEFKTSPEGCKFSANNWHFQGGKRVS